MDMAMLSARLILDKDYVISQVDKRLYGSFVDIWGGVSIPVSMNRGTLWRTSKASAGIRWRWCAA